MFFIDFYGFVRCFLQFCGFPSFRKSLDFFFRAAAELKSLLLVRRLSGEGGVEALKRRLVRALAEAPAADGVEWQARKLSEIKVTRVRRVNVCTARSCADVHECAALSCA